jgi:hypothetical protein
MRRLFGLLPLLVLLAPLSAGAGTKKDSDKKDDDDSSSQSDDGDKKKDKKKKDDDDVDLGDTHALPDANSFKEDDDEGPKTVPSPDKDESDDEDKKKDDDEFNLDDDDDGKKIDFKDDEVQGDVKPRGPGEDTAQIYRDAQKKNSQMTPDEELLAWERYLKKYPNSLFKDRIETREEELSSSLFNERVPGSDTGARNEDAAKRELNFAVPTHFAPIDTRSRVRAGFEVGIPNWASFHADGEWAILRELSIHGGVEYALIKSARTGTILTGGVDLRLYTGPAFVGIRPVVGFGQRIRFMEGLDLQATLAVDPEFRSPFGMRYFGGFGAELHPNKTVAVFAETTMNYKHWPTDDEDFGPFRFDVVTFGLKFNVNKPKNADGDQQIDVGIGANIPYSINYWGFYRGAVDVNGNWNL